jgi:isoquinoline 1-oxidoreductase subunit beta
VRHRVPPRAAAGTPHVSRRLVLTAGVALGGGFLLRCNVMAGERSFEPNAFLRITEDGQITFIAPKAEMGQGTHTSMAMLLAEELEVDLGGVTIEQAPPNDALYGNPLLGGLQVTGASSSVRSMFELLRLAGATTRVMLTTAAARMWRVELLTCRAEAGAIIHSPSGRRLKYGQLASAAARVPVPTGVALKNPEGFKLIGRPVKRLDTPAKVDGSAKFSIDVQMPGLRIATVAACPVFGGKLKNVEDSVARTLPGVRQIVCLDDAVAVIGDGFWAAKRGLKALGITWKEGTGAHVNTDQIVEETAAATARPGAVACNRGDVEAVFRQAARRMNAIYQVPFLAHATMEPMNCTVHLRADRCVVWVGTQVPTIAQSAVAQAVEMPINRVEIHNQLLGGGFGRRLEVDFIVQAAQIARHTADPVKVIWTREEDMQHDFYRPCYCDRLGAALDVSGKLIGWSHRVAGASILSRVSPDEVRNGIDSDAVEGAATLLYEIDNLRVEYVRHEPATIPTGFWRGVGPNHSVFAVESFLDELAAAGGRDPMAFRCELLSQVPRAQAVLDLVATKAGWGRPMVARAGRGVSFQFAFGSYMAQVAEIIFTPAGALRVTRVVCACDAGIVVNPDTLRAQIEGGILFGLTAALFGEITIKDGRVQQTNFSDYRMLRINETPTIEVHLVHSAAAPGGIGEAATAAIAPAVGNAIFAAIRTRLRRLPFNIRELGLM